MFCNPGGWSPQPTLMRRTLLAGAGAFLVFGARPTRSARQPDLARMAGNAVDGLLRNFWEGPADSGHIRPTWSGYDARRHRLPDLRGALWERAMMVNALFEFHALTGAPEIAARLRADWRWVTSAFSEADLTECGKHSHANWADDDTGWNSSMFLQAHAITRDAAVLRYATRTVRTAYDRWHDDTLGGGLWRDDDRARKTLYETALALAALRLHTATGEARSLP